MIGFLIYDMKVAVLVAVFYMFYRLLLSRDTLHRLNRVVLLTTAVASFVLPLCVITIHHEVVVPLVSTSVMAELPIMAVIEPSQPALPLWQQLAVAVFFAGLAVTLGYLLWSIGQVIYLIRHCDRHPQADGTIVCVTGKEVSPFSWMRYIVLNRKDFESPDPAVMAHERGHIRQRHSLDVILVDTLTALQWFNPAMWMLRQDLRAIHEYEADAAVLSQGINMRQYQYLLIQKAVAACGYSVANGITHSTLKNRINMMLNNKKTTRTGWHRACPYMFKLFALLPIVGAALVLNAETVNDYVYQQPPQQQVVKKGRKDGQIKVGTQTIEVHGEARPFALHAVADEAGRIVGLSSEGEVDPRYPLQYTVGRIFFDNREATLEEIINHELLGYEVYEMIHHPNSDGDPKWNYKDKEGILVFHKKQKTEPNAAVIMYHSTYQEGTDPLVVIDGRRVTKAEMEALPKDSIERVAALKPEFATTLYGEDGRNGVVEITTKGKANQGLNKMVTFEVKAKKPQENAAVFEEVEQMPEYPGGMGEMMKFLMTNVKYPEAAKEAGAQGRVLVGFIVEADGSITNIEVDKKVNDDLDAEAIRVVGAMPKWKPGMHKGKAVRVKFTLPISFKLNGQETPKGETEASPITVVGQ